MIKRLFLLACLAGLVFSCSCEKRAGKNRKAKAEYILRKDGSSFYPAGPLQRRVREDYPWEKNKLYSLPKITKDFFRCKGSLMHPPIVDASDPERIVTFKDCSGRHLFGSQPGVYPILVDLLNFLQTKTCKKAVITSGYRCPEHNQYIDRSIWGRNSKHLIGAEVDFYVEGYEEKPEKIVQLLMDFYQSKRYHKKKEYQIFSRYEKKTNVTEKPWFNKEIFIKLYKASEGRNFDNRHPYSYLSVQVRYDCESKKRVLTPN